MIVVTARCGGIKIEGHAGYAPAGQDIVCAGVTALTQTLIQSLEDLSKDKIEYSISPGRVDINYGNLSKAGKLLLDSFFCGISQIADEFPQNVKII